MGFSKSSSKREVYSNTILPQETRRTLNRQPNFTPEAIGKRKLQISRRKEIMIRAEISEKEMKETIVKFSTNSKKKKKSWFFEKISKINSPLADSSRKKERRIKSTKLEVKKERLQQIREKYKGL